MSYFVLKPNPDGLAAEAKADVIKRCQESEAELEIAEKNLDLAVDQHYDGDPRNLKGAKEIQKAEEAVDAARARHRYNTLKLAWEHGHQWKRKIQVHPKAMPKPWIIDPKNWLSIFKKFNPL